MVWPGLKIFWFSKDNPTGHSERKKEKEADRRRGGKTISKSGQEWTLPAQLGQLKTGEDGKGLLQIHLCASTTFQGGNGSFRSYTRSDPGSFQSYSLSVRSFRPGSFWPDFRGGSFRPNFGGSFRPTYFI